MGAVTVNPVQTSQYNLTAVSNPITFGTATNIDVTSGGNVVYGNTAADWTVTNEGSLQGYTGLLLNSSSTVTNAGAIAATGVYGVGVILNAGGTVSNENGGNIGGYTGVELGAGGKVTNHRGGTITGYGGPGIYITGGVGTVINAATIYGGSEGVRLNAGGTVTNASGGTIGSLYGGSIYISGGTGIVNNAGTLIGGVSLATPSSVVNRATGTIDGNYSVGGYGVALYGGSVINAGKITGFYVGVEAYNAATVINQTGGAICGGLSGVVMGAGFLINHANATITGATGVYAAGMPITVTNAGTITGTTLYPGLGDGVSMSAGGTVTNATGGSITGAYAGVYIAHGGRVANAGTISGYWDGVKLGAGSSMTNAGTITATGTGGFGVLLKGSSLTNRRGGTISSYGEFSVGVFSVGSTVTNAGTITSGQTGVVLTGGTLTNQRGGIITGYYGIGVSLAPSVAGTVTNAGTITNVAYGAGVALEIGTVTNQKGGRISGDYMGVYLGGAGTVTNQTGGAITGGYAGVIMGFPVGGGPSGFGTGDGDLVNDAKATITGDSGVYALRGVATVTNAGSIVGTTVVTGSIGGITFSFGDGVSMEAGGTVTNQAGGRITGAGAGVYIANDSGTVTDAGRISGTVASVEFAGVGDFTLTLQTGAVLIGNAIGSTAAGATNALVLQGAGVAKNAFLDFTTLTVQAGATWTLGTLSLESAVLAASATVTIGAGDTLTLDGQVTGGGSFIIGTGATLLVDATTTTTSNLVNIGGGIGVADLTGGSGADTFEFAAAHLTAKDTVAGGAGTDTLEFTTAGTITASAFTHVSGIDVIDLANGTNSLGLSEAVVAASDAQSLTIRGGAGNDTIRATSVAAGLAFNGGGGADTIVGGQGDNIYDFDNIAGQTLSIANGFAGGTASHGQLDFGAGITDEKLWFERSGSNLVADVIGTTEQVTVKNWFIANKSTQLSEIDAGGLKLDTQVSQLVSAMATYSANNPGFNPVTATAVPTDTTLQNAIAAAWHH